MEDQKEPKTDSDQGAVSEPTPAAESGHEAIAPVQLSKPPKRHHRIQYAIVAFLLIALAATGLLLHHQRYAKPQQHTSSSTKSTQTTKKATTTGYVLYQSPVKLDNLNFFSDTAKLFGTDCTNSSETTDCPPTVTAEQISYAQIGLTPSKKPIVVAFDEDLGEGSFYFVAIENTPGNYAINGQLNAQLDPNNKQGQDYINTLKASISSNVTLDTTTTITPLVFPKSITVGNESFAIPSNYTGPSGYFINGLPNIRGTYFKTPLQSSQITKLGSNGTLTYYEVTAESQPSYQVHEIYATVGGVYAAGYVPSDPLAASTAPSIHWDGGTVNTVTYKTTSQGCGSANGFVVGKGIESNQLTKIGTGPNNQTLYELPENSVLFNAYYQTYGSGTDLQSSSLQNLSADQFQNDHAVFVAKNALGEYVVYQRSDMFTGGGCGEPVIYLYPQVPSEINVQVGATVSVSKPQYAANGWQNVFALPTGKLIYNGQPYNSLVWEGIGEGSYPLITSGTIVPRSDAVTTIKKQLMEQGLTTSEVSDFLSYWQPKLPKTPYIRLTWLTTDQMNHLAPLQITPKPATVIRTFLDFQGLDHPMQITPQTFSTPKRQGFTVVEWGGLLRGADF